MGTALGTAGDTGIALKVRCDGTFRDRIKAAAERAGCSMQEYGYRALEEQMARDGAATVEQESLPAIQTLLESMEKSIERRQANVVGQVYGEVLRLQEFLRAYAARTLDSGAVAALAQAADQATRARVERGKG